MTPTMRTSERDGGQKDTELQRVATALSDALARLEELANAPQEAPVVHIVQASTPSLPPQAPPPPAAARRARPRTYRTCGSTNSCMSQ